MEGGREGASERRGVEDGWREEWDQCETEWCHCEAGELLVCFLWQCADCSVSQQLSPSPVSIE